MTFNRCVAVDQWESMGRPDILEKNCHSTCPKSMIETTRMYHPNMKVEILAIPPRRDPGDVCCKWRFSMRVRGRPGVRAGRDHHEDRPLIRLTRRTRPPDPRARYCTGRYKNEGEVEPMDIPESFAGGADVTGKRVVITGAGRGLGRLLAHAFSHGGRPAGTRGADRGGPEVGRRGAAGPVRRVQRRRDRRRLQRGRRRRRGDASSAASTSGSATRGSHRSSPRHARPIPPSGGGSST